jgi:hypothetical protein
MATKILAMPKGQSALIAGLTDQQNWEFYDYQTYAAAGQAQLNFFQSAPGANGRTLEDTNFPGSGSLPAGMGFVLQELMFNFLPGAAVLPGSFGAAAAPRFVNDVVRVGQSGAVELIYSSKTFVQNAPLSRFPMDVSADGFGAAADATTAGANLQTLLNYAQWRGRPQRIADMLLEPQVNLLIRVSWPNGVVATPSTVAGKLGCIMKGVLGRVAQ